jgi:hypothetical protein
VLSPGDFDRASLTPDAPASERLAFANASPVSSLPFSTTAFAFDTMTYTTTPVLLETVATVATALASAAATSTNMVNGTSTPVTTSDGGALFVTASLALSLAVTISAFLM